MKELQELAAKLLSEKTVQVVIGYEQGPQGARPCFITQPDQAVRLIFDQRCVHNLIAYLSPRRSHLAALGRKAVIVKGCDARALAGLIREGQIHRDAIVSIGVRCGGVVRSPRGAEPLTEDTAAARCAECRIREPHLADYVVGPGPMDPPANRTRAKQIALLEAMSPEERLAYWEKQFSRCIRCHACRAVCPMCYCERCIADKSQPQWIESSPHLRGNFAWNTIRALHLAGRCSDCGECERACPADIPLSLVNRKTAMIVESRYHFQSTDDPDIPAPIGAYRLDDEQEFIL